MSLMLKEEFRSHATYSGKERFLTFPVFVFFLSTVVGLTLDRITETVTLEELATFSHLSSFIYGLSVGAFGLMGRQYLERRYGRSNYLVTMPYLLPLSFRSAFLGIFLLHIPGGDQFHAVRIGVHRQEDDVIQEPKGLVIVSAHHLPDELHELMRPDDLGGVEAPVDPYDRLPLHGQSPGLIFCQVLGQRQAAGDVPVVFELPVIVG